MDIVSTRKQRLAEAIALAGGSVSVLAERAGVSEKYLRQVLAGFKGPKDRNPRSIGKTVARRIEAAVGKPVGWMDTPPSVASLLPQGAPEAPKLQILQQVVPRTDSDTLPSALRQMLSDSKWSDVVPVPILAGDPANNPLTAQGAVTGAMLLSREWIARNVPGASMAENLAALPATSDVMEPTFTTGDVLLVDRGVDRVRADGIYAFVLGGELLIKRLQRKIDGGLLVLADNARYAAQELAEGDIGRLQILGRVLVSWNLHRH